MADRWLRSILLLLLLILVNCDQVDKQLVKTELLTASVTKLQQQVGISCRSLESSVLIVRLHKLPLGGNEKSPPEIFAVANDKGEVKEPWSKRNDVSFNATTATITFNMTAADEGRYRCDFVTLDGQGSANLVELVTAMEPDTPVLTFNGKTAASLDMLEGETLSVNCTANAGKPAGDLQVFFSGSNESLATRNVTWTAPIGQDTFSVFKSVSASLRIDQSKHNATITCGLVPNAELGDAGNKSLTVTGPIISVMFPVRDIELKPYRENFFHGDVITCSAAGRPGARISWEKVQGPSDLQVNNSKLVMQDSAITGYYSYSCYATNVVRGAEHRLQQLIGFTLHNRTAAPSTSTPTGKAVTNKVRHWVRDHSRTVTITLVSVGVLCGLAVLAALVLYFCGVADGGAGETRYGRLNKSPQERVRYYGELNDTANYSSEDEDAHEPLNKTEGAWVGTQV